MAIDKKQLEETYHFTYASHLMFENPSLKQELQKACLHQAIPKKARHHGNRYAHELLLGYEPPSEILWINDEVGYGLYSSSELLPGAFIGEYTGLVCTNNPYYKMSNYCFHYPIIESNQALSINAESYGNLTRFINHSFTPNLDILHAFHEGLYHVILVTNRSIKQGEHFTYNYGHSYWYLRGAPYHFPIA
jgi:uncharacterized protein